jgi:16S rRNA (guanine1207-N2)-methyltransferase
VSKGVNVQDPWVTLGECLNSASPVPTLIWGGGIEYLDEDQRTQPWISFFSHDTQTLQALDLPVETRVFPSEQTFERLIVRLPSSKELLGAMLGWAQRSLIGARECWVFGHKMEGIRSVEALLAGIGSEPESLRIKRRTRVLTSQLGESDGTDSMPELRRTISVGHDNVQCVSLPGIFAHGRLDKGTSALLAFLARHKPTKRIVDLGCGSGAIGLFLAQRWPEASVTLYDKSALAVIAAKESAELNGIENVKIVAQPVTEIPKEPWHGMVVSNPPFHDGKETRTDLIHDFAQAAKSQMRPGAVFLAVANRHLPYRKALSQTFHSVEIAWEDNHYCIWRCKGPRKT